MPFYIIKLVLLVWYGDPHMTQRKNDPFDPNKQIDLIHLCYTYEASNLELAITWFSIWFSHSDRVNKKPMFYLGHKHTHTDTRMYARTHMWLDKLGFIKN